MLDRYENERKLFEQQCTGSDGNACRMHKWTSFIESIRSKTPLEQIRAVNKEMNKSQYVLDIVNWGMQDYWATPLEFFIKNGDCEDYAISKYLSLRLLGFTEAQLRIVVLQDLNLGVPHAILIVNLNGKAMALDNFFAQPVASTKIHHYKPIYSINETAWWRHR